MFNTSVLHKTIFADPAHVVQSKVTIAGTDYEEGAGLWDLSITGALYAEDHPCIGGACAREIDLELKNPGEIPRMAQMDVYSRVAMVDPITGETTSAAEWIPRGVFYIATRSFDASGEFLTIHGYDAMLKGEQAFLDQESGETGEWPQSMADVAAMCAAMMGVEIDPRTVLNPDYTMSYPNDYTCRELLQHIAAANAGNWTISCEGKLWLRQLVEDADVLDIGEEAMDLSTSPRLTSISMVRLWADDGHCYEAGDGAGRLLEADCPWATQEITEAVLAAVSALSYVPMEVTDAFIDPAVELGDLLTVAGITSPIGSMTETFGSDYSATVSAPADDEVDNEYPFVSGTAKKFDRQLAKTRSLIATTTEELLMMVEGFDGRISKLSVDVAGITGEVRGLEEDYAAFRLTVEGFWVDGPNGSTLIAGSLIDTSTLNVDNINIDLSGRIAFTDLTDYRSVQSDIDEAYDLAAEAWDMADSVQLPAYIKSTYIDFTKVQSPRIEANDIGLYGGYFEIYDGSGTTKYGSLGFGSGLTTAGGTTYGMVMSAEGNTNLGEEGNYFIATNAGVRMQSGASKVYAVDGMAVLESHGNQIYVGPAGAYIKVGGVISAINGSSGGGGTGGGGGGNMSTAVYDANGEVATAGGIVAYVSSIVGKIDILLAHINDGNMDAVLDQINGEVV